MVTLTSIYRYPIKGLPGEMLPEVELAKGCGLPGDRQRAIQSGALPVKPEGEWTACQAFQRLTIRPELTCYDLRSDGDVLQVTAPSGALAEVWPESAGVAAFEGDLDGQTQLARAAAGRGYWDHPDAAVSIINLSTVEAIGKALGREIDPLRFRGNLYVRARPWEEFSWLGKTLRFGGVDLQIIRPIDRCKGTSVNVQTGALDVNMPAALHQHFGHIYCGVYATVRQSGVLAPGLLGAVGEEVSQEAVAQAAAVETAPPVAQWPRGAQVTSVVQETAEVRSVWLEDSLAGLGTVAGLRAGQYVRLHNLASGGVWRSYTVSAAEGGQLRISVKRDQGAGSPAVHHVSEGDHLVISGPYGEATLRSEAEAVTLVSAGIGITPTVAKLRQLVAAGWQKPVQVVHVARSLAEAALWDECESLAAALPQAVVQLHLTQANGAAESAIAGRPDLATLARSVAQASADVHVCGPVGFVAAFEARLAAAGIPMERVFVDRLASPGATSEMRDIPEVAPISVTLARSKITATWQPSDGTLLEFAEKHGVLPPSHCRAGLCGSCKCGIKAGRATRLSGPEGEDTTQTLICCSVPSGPLVLDV
ncbi:MOSC domain-containing protein [Shimia sp. MIT1388]|uniref:MOSC domain-containing protein n=1 Tax=Shimia sp. MIT1388 TaxID=3096992 RepID=UPI0039999E77